MLNLKRIELTMENCEVVNIPGNLIGQLDIENVRHEIHRVAMNYIDSYDVAGLVFLEVFSEDNQGHNPFGDDVHARRFNRLTKYNDITQIDIVLDDDRKEHYLVDWESCETNGDENQNQKSYVSDLGNLYIVIAKDKEIEDLIELDFINDKEETDFRRDVYDIGVEEYPTRFLSDDCLPDFYRYVDLGQNDCARERTALAVRVPDAEVGWKFVFCGDSDVLHFPTTWRYYSDKLAKFVDEENKKKGLDIETLKAKYPLVENSDVEHSLH